MHWSDALCWALHSVTSLEAVSFLSLWEDGRGSWYDGVKCGGRVGWPKLWLRASCSDGFARLSMRAAILGSADTARRRDIWVLLFPLLTLSMPCRFSFSLNFSMAASDFSTGADCFCPMVVALVAGRCSVDNLACALFVSRSLPEATRREKNHNLSHKIRAGFWIFGLSSQQSSKFHCCNKFYFIFIFVFSVTRYVKIIGTLNCLTLLENWMLWYQSILYCHQPQ